MMWEIDVARVGKKINAHWALVEKPEEDSLLEDLGVEERIILKWIPKKYRPWDGPDCRNVI
jgi:hypothetical protein